MRQIFICLAVIAGLLAGALPAAAQEAVGGVKGIVQMRSSNASLTAAPSAYPEETNQGGGSVSWNFNSSGDIHPAAGNTVQLIAWDSEALQGLTSDEIEAWYSRETLPKDRRIFQTTTGADGHYKFSNIPAGRYFLVIISRAGSSDTEKNDSPEMAAELQKYLPNWDMYDLFVLGPHFYTVQPVDVKPGKEVSVDHLYKGSIQVVEASAMDTWWQRQQDWQLHHHH